MVGDPSMSLHGRQGITHDETETEDIGTFQTAGGADVFCSIRGIYLQCGRTGVVCLMRLPGALIGDLFTHQLIM